MLRESENCCFSQQKLWEKGKWEAGPQSKAAFVLQSSCFSSSLSDKSSTLMMVNFWLFTNPPYVAASIKEELWLATAGVLLRGHMTLPPQEMHHISQTINSMHKTRSEKL